VYALALIIEAPAPTFNGTKNSGQALKVAAYSSTAGWLVGVFSLVPALSFLQILGLDHRWLDHFRDHRRRRRFIHLISYAEVTPVKADSS